LILREKKFLETCELQIAINTLQIAITANNLRNRNAMIGVMEPLHISEVDAVRDLAALLKRVQSGPKS
jgi:hypothetical protein